eukprot:14087579-Alexandrium_andersonii.AAC.1
MPRSCKAGAARPPGNDTKMPRGNAMQEYPNSCLMPSVRPQPSPRNLRAPPNQQFRALVPAAIPHTK